MNPAIGILGGTFAPIHNGHLRLAIEAREQLSLAEVRLVPAAQPPLRAMPAVSAARRLHWVDLAIKGEAGLVCDARELTRSGPSYTVDTLEELRAEFPEAPLCLLLGLDAAQQLPAWHRWERLIELAHLVFFNRPGQVPDLSGALAALLARRQAHSAAELHESPAGRWWRVAMPPVPVSATDIRRRLRENRSVRGLLPDRVLDSFTPSDLELLKHDENPQ